jgi:DASH complex subunit ASK1
MTNRRINSRYKSDALDSSPALEAPELRHEIFGTPATKKRIPGVSVLTPAHESTKKAFGGEERLGGKSTTLAPKNSLWDSDSEDEFLEGMSPPKTMQFHIPQSKLLKTPGNIFSLDVVTRARC